MTPDGLRLIIKEVLKEVIKEDLDLKKELRDLVDDYVVMFGRWSMKTLTVLIITALIYFVLFISGWKKQ